LLDFLLFCVVFTPNYRWIETAVEGEKQDILWYNLSVQHDTKDEVKG